MEMMQLEMFVRVAEERSVQKAATIVHRTQPAVSIALRKLTGEIGVPLFSRAHKRDFRLTQAGEVLYEYATRIIGLRDEAHAALKEEQNGCSACLAVGVNGAAALHRFPRMAKLFQRQFPNVRIEMKCDAPENLLRELSERRVDLLLLSHPPENLPGDSGLATELLPASASQANVYIVRRQRGQSHLAGQFERTAAVPAKNRPVPRWRPRDSAPSFRSAKPPCTRQAVH